MCPESDSESAVLLHSATSRTWRLYVNVDRGTLARFPFSSGRSRKVAIQIVDANESLGKILTSSSALPVTQEQPSRKGASFFRLRTINQ